jgi:hypothetical protein
MSKKTINQKLSSYRTLIFNSRNEEIAPYLAQYGIDAAYLDEGEELYRETMRLVDLQKQEYKEERTAFDIYYAQKDEVEKMFKKTRDLVRALCRNDPDLQSRLNFSPLSGRRIHDWIQTGIEFYNGVLLESSILEKLAKFNITTEQLRGQKQELENLLHLRTQTALEKGQAQEATRQRNQKLEELEDYCNVLKTVAAIALADRPQLMESLGVLVRS